MRDLVVVSVARGAGGEGAGCGSGTGTGGEGEGGGAVLGYIYLTWFLHSARLHLPCSAERRTCCVLSIRTSRCNMTVCIHIPVLATRSAMELEYSRGFSIFAMKRIGNAARCHVRCQDDTNFQASSSIAIEEKSRDWEN